MRREGFQGVMRGVVSILVGALALSGCAQGGLTKATSLSPTPFAASASAQEEDSVGIIGGGLIGGALGSGLSAHARRMAIEAEYRALEATPAGEPVQWQDTASGRSGGVVAAQPYRVGSQDCRQYEHTIDAGGSQRKARGTACRNPDGSWTLLS